MLFGFIAPLLLDPLFDRFTPAPRHLSASLTALAERAGLAVGEVLVSEASRTTERLSAYVAGLGATRRIVLSDTLVTRAQLREINFVAAHELAHRRQRHPEASTALGVAAVALIVVGYWMLTRSERVLWATGANAPSDPRTIPLLLLFALASLALIFPLVAAISRGWERQADRIALALTRGPEGAEAVLQRFAATNLHDPDPPQALYLLTYTHPPLVERIRSVRRAAG